MNPPHIDWNAPEIEKIRRDMLRFAQLQMQDAAQAEDMVQEALLGAMASSAGFGGRASFKTWMFTILRNKIVDHIRRHAREITQAEFDTLLDEGHERLDPLFAHSSFGMTGMWSPAERPRHWSEPDAALSRKQFWDIFEICVNHLPERVSQVYMMREFLELGTDEICAQLNISRSNCWVILHRARTGLRECLEDGWFNAKARK